MNDFPWDPSPSDPLADLVAATEIVNNAPFYQSDFTRKPVSDRIPVPVFDFERRASIAELNGPTPKCDSICLYGTCSGPDWSGPGCGGCCRCLGGCGVDYENHHIAPFLWEGDYA